MVGSIAQYYKTYLFGIHFQQMGRISVIKSYSKLPLLWSWVHACLSVESKSNHLTLSHRDSRRRGKITTGFVYSPWKSGFMRQHNIEMNWRVNPIRSPKVEISWNCCLLQVIFQTLISLCCRCWRAMTTMWLLASSFLATGSCRAVMTTPLRSVHLVIMNFLESRLQTFDELLSVLGLVRDDW